MYRAPHAPPLRPHARHLTLPLSPSPKDLSLPLLRHLPLPRNRSVSSETVRQSDSQTVTLACDVLCMTGVYDR